MVLMTLVVIPVAFLGTYTIIDVILSLADPTYGQLLVSAVADTVQKAQGALAEANNEYSTTWNLGFMFLPAVIGYICNFLYFLLCGVFFKNHKIVWGIAIMCGFSMVLSILFGLLVPILMLKMPHFEMDELQAAHLVVGLMNGTLVFCCLLALGLGWGIWRRVKTLQH
jgi:hypothetical protein